MSYADTNLDRDCDDVDRLYFCRKRIAPYQSGPGAPRQCRTIAHRICGDCGAGRLADRFDASGVIEAFAPMQNLNFALNIRGLCRILDRSLRKGEHQKPAILQ